MNQLDKVVRKHAKKASTLQFQVTEHLTNNTYVFSTTHVNQKFHSASVGKVFCAVLVMKDIESKRLTLDQKITTILEEDQLEQLFVFQGFDWKNEVTISHLLSHTSGINDYFEGKTHNEKRFIDHVLSHKDHLYTPKELLDFTRLNQKAVSAPGKKFLYSDSGYILLAWILEKLHQKTYSELLNDSILIPLGLKDTLLCFYDERFDQTQLAPIYFNRIKMDQATSLSCDYAGGGLQTTTQDLSRFLHALFSYQLISQDSVETLIQPKNAFHGIMGYGLGIVSVKMHYLVPWMRHYPTLYGGLGSLSVHAFYDRENQRSIIINFGDPAKMRQSFMLLAKTMKLIGRKAQA